MTDNITDAGLLREQYGDGDRLCARQSLWRLKPGPTLQSAALDLAGLRGDEVVVDVGCGTGLYLGELRRRGHLGTLLGLDFSPGMARRCAAHGAAAVADAQALPLRYGSADVALSMHMLYHVPDVARSVRELRRVVRPGGAVLLGTNGAGHAAEVDRFVVAAAARVVGEVSRFDWATSRFSPAVARAEAEAVFGEVELHDLGGSFPVTEAQPLVDYVASLPPATVGLTSGPEWTEVVAVARELVLAEMSTHGQVVVTNRPIVLRCR